MVGDGEIEPEKPQHAADEPLGLSQREMEDEPEHEHELDREIRVAPLPARRGPARRLPLGNRGLVQPEREIATPLQPSLVGRPVLDAVPGPRDAMAAGMVMLEGQGLTASRWRAAPLLRSGPSGQPRCTNAQAALILDRARDLLVRQRRHYALRRRSESSER